MLVAGCSSSSDGKKSDEVPVPKGLEVPKGVTLTKGGATLTEDKPASVVYQVGDKAASVITVTVSSVRKGSIEKDFTFFSLDDETKSQCEPLICEHSLLYSRGLLGFEATDEERAMFHPVRQRLVRTHP